MISNVIIWIVQVIYFILPGVMANITPVLMKGVFKKLAFPLDGHKTYKGNRILGNNKTFRGLLFGVIASILTVYLQAVGYANPVFEALSLQNYSETNLLLFGFLAGFGPLFADLVNSFIKRRLNKKEGSKFMPWDQLNAPIGGIIAVSWIYNGEKLLLMIVSVLIISFLVHILNRTIGYYTKISNERW